VFRGTFIPSGSLQCVLFTLIHTHSLSCKCSAHNKKSEFRCIACRSPLNQAHPIKPDKTSQHDVDEFGRIKTASSTKSHKWPPVFTRRSATYVFDAVSSMFYHASTQFFYDPKTKLYYGNQQKLYYRHCPGQNPPFQEYEGQTGNEHAPKLIESKKPAISIKLKTKVLARSHKEGVKSAVLSSPVPKSNKTTDDNLNRWTERNREKRGELEAIITKAGQPVCLLCKRKFKDINHLYRHEQTSDMHKSNLNRHLERKKHLTPESQFYRDRALERRILHGPESHKIANNNSEIEEPKHTLEIKPEDQIGDNNIGNKMLERLGWKSGEGLGRHGASEQSLSIKKDWERIEALARQENKHSSF